MKGIDIAKSKLGLNERNNRKELIAFFKENRIDCDPLTTPWCAAFVNSCERAAGNPGNGMLNARSFLTYGSKVNMPQPGDIVIFSRGGSTYQGHVAYFKGFEGNFITTIGGNQSDSVTKGYYHKDRILGYRRY